MSELHNPDQSSRALFDLCRVLLKGIYGDLSAVLVGSLLDYGRQTAVELSKTTKLPLSAVHSGLAALVQNRFVLYWANDRKSGRDTDDIGESSSIYYVANWKEIYQVVRAGGMVDAVRKDFGISPGGKSNPESGERCAEIAQNLLVYGHMRVSDYLEATPEHDRDNVEASIAVMLRKRFLVPVQAWQFKPETDVYARMFRTHLSQLPLSMAESARKNQAALSAKTELERLQEERNSLNLGFVSGSVARSKGVSVLNRAEKLDHQAVLCANPDKFLVIARNEELARLAEERCGKTAAEVYRQCLSKYVGRLHSCSQETSPGAEFNITSMEIAKTIDPRLAGLRPRGKGSRSASRSASPRPMSKRVKTEDGYTETGDYEEDEEDEEDGQQLSGVALATAVSKQMQILAASPLLFVKNVGTKGGGEWYVDFKEATENLRGARYEQIIQWKYGRVAKRLLRAVKDKGKVDEKLLTNIALLPVKEILNHLHDLHSVGALDVQELPRTADRAASRTIFLWHHRANRAYSLITQDIYKSLSRCFERVAAERAKLPILLSKLQREDVKGHEDEFLTEQEKADLKNLKMREEKLLVQMNRLDGMIRVFRDY
ncbi:DNA-directed RNA polymerase III subunit RPC3 [Yarrowia sp. C11]|nr:DNA-directed RNA polymerase III subunit RPC3 [Yarrowia sp. C11]KAG5364710.1 DNA-directed RNA polymerase III subunit RPC3 [Yarrowia sp. E02]